MSRCVTWSKHASKVGTGIGHAKIYEEEETDNTLRAAEASGRSDSPGGSASAAVRASTGSDVALNIFQVYFFRHILVLLRSAVQKGPTDGVNVVVVVVSSPRSGRPPGKEPSLVELKSLVSLPTKAFVSAEPPRAPSFVPGWAHPARGPSAATSLAGGREAKRSQD